MAEHPVSLLELLVRPTPGLSELLNRVAAQQHLLRQVQNRLPESLKAHCLYVSARDDRLTVFTESSPWSTRLRYYAPELLQALNQGRSYQAHPRDPTRGHYREIRLRILPPCQSRMKPTRPSLRLSRKNAELICATAAGIKDPGLKAALERLARRGEHA